ncbi:cell division protein FtsL [Bacillus piscicola]|uniref:cell division protein FtsL n=1 Tax=Bacillus piscicola TaxID=1632684 RepID=UPI001F089DD2|nr:cell division protein FtsL [Bacillus piscicola]
MTNLAQQIHRQNQEKQAVHTTIEKRRVRGKITKGEKLIALTMVLAIICASFLVISNYAKVYAQDREITNLTYSIKEQAEINNGYEVEVSELSAPDRIMYYAKEELGMTLNDDKVKVIQESAP